MATYYHGGSEIQENQQTLYVMNPNYSYIAAYSDTNNSNNMLLLNALSQGGFPHAPPPPPAAQPFLWSSSAPAQQLSLSLSPQQRNPAARGVVVGSKYLKAAEELLDEVVRVHREKEKGVAAASDVAVSREAGESSQMVVHQLLSSAQRQDLHMKKAKLINMLHEVEQKYKEYQSQMQAVVSCLEQETGPGSAKSYTSLALRTISKQFRCLKEGITSQVKATNKSLGMGGDEDHHQDGVKPVGSRLSLVDHQLRQQRALHQLGMMGHNSTVWRPQRGLPERAVSVLRAWLFEHFLHPYPKDSDKHMLAKQTGLTRSQVSNWFINARVRLWKPMVEEMYSEEVKAQEHNGDKTTTTNGNTTTTAVPPANGNETTATKSPKRLRSNKNRSSSPSSILSMEIKGQGQSQGDQSGFNPVYVVSDLTRTISPDHMAGPYGSNLTLGLPTNIHEQVFMPNNNINNNELGRRVEGGADFWGISINNSSSSSHPVSDNGFHAIDIDIQTRKTFAAHQLLHDFVA